MPGQATRKRLIFVGLTADRVGWRCFDPITFKFTTEFELIFDEKSSRKRINSLREYDIRRELQRRGKLEGLELQQDDFQLDALAQDLERQVYSSSSSQESSSSGGASRTAKGRGDVPRTSLGRGDGAESDELERTSDDLGSVSAPGRRGVSGKLQVPTRGADQPSGRSDKDNDDSNLPQSADVKQGTPKKEHWPRVNSPSATFSVQHPNPASVKMGRSVGLSQSVASFEVAQSSVGW